MPGPTPVHTTFDAILPRLHLMLAAGTGLDPGAIGDTADDDPAALPALLAPQCLWLRPGDELPDREFMKNPGRKDRRVHRTLRITCRTRVSLDPAGKATQLLTEETRGLLVLENAVMRAIDDEMVQDAGQNLLTVYPVEWTGSTAPVRVPGKKDWAQSVLTFDVWYRRQY